MNAAASSGMALLVVFSLFSLLGPIATDRDFARVYPDYVRARPSLRSHPSADEAKAAFSRVAGHMRARVEDFALVEGVAHGKLVSANAIDLRALVFFERSDAFGSAQQASAEDSGRAIRVVAQLKPLWLPLGSDANGRDLAARLMLAGRVSLLIGLLGSAVALGVGVTYGLIAGYSGGVVDIAMMRIVDALYALPFIFFVILLTAFFGRSFLLLFVAIGAVEWLDMARLTRGQTLSLKSREFVLAARALGADPVTISLRHIAPNLASVILAYLAVLAPRIIIAESFLSFLGLGVREPLTSIGVLVADGAQHLQDAPWLLVAPAALLLILLLGLTLLSDSTDLARRRG